MKKLLTIIIAIAIAAPFFTACKKGENDPMSLKSRKARLIGEWELVEWEKTETTTTTSGADIITYNFSGSSLSRTSSGTTTIYMYSESNEIMKDGTYNFESSQTNTEASTTTMIDSEGTWAWVAGNKEDDLKNKERVCFTTTRSTTTSGSSSSITTDDGDKDVSIIRIDNLGSKELVLVVEETYTYPSLYDGTTVTVTIEETKTYEKK